MKAFIQPYQYNILKKELARLLNVVYFAGDFRVYAATKQTLLERVHSLFSDMTPTQAVHFDGITEIKGQKELNAFLEQLRAYVIPFPELGSTDLRRLFKKEKKLLMPDLSPEQFNLLTYFGWRDLATNTIYIVYPLHGRMIGVKCRYYAGDMSQRNVCCICQEPQKGSEVGLLVARTNATAYKTVGNYICLNSTQCNQQLTNIEVLESFLTRAISTK